MATASATFHEPLTVSEALALKVEAPDAICTITPTGVPKTRKLYSGISGYQCNPWQDIFYPRDLPMWNQPRIASCIAWGERRGGTHA